MKPRKRTTAGGGDERELLGRGLTLGEMRLARRGLTIIYAAHAETVLSCEWQNSNDVDFILRRARISAVLGTELLTGPTGSMS